MLINRFKSLFSSQYILNLGWLGGAELAQRIFRLATTVTIARLFSATDYGMVSAIYSVFEFVNVVSMRGGISAKIIQADDEELDEVCDAAHSLNWLFMGSIFIIQCLLAYPISLFYQDTQLALPICALGLSYLIMPNFTIKAAILERQNKLQVRAWGVAAQALASNLIIVILAWRGAGVWSVVCAIVLSYLVWIPIINRAIDWEPKQFPYFNRWKSILSFGGKRLGVDLLGRFREDADYLIVARFLGLEALGIYFFAYSAGIGISQGVTRSLSTAWYPYFCEARRDKVLLKERFFKSLKTIAMTVLPLVALQSCLAPFYVPIIFGEKWVDAIPILILICMSAVPMAMARSTSRLLQAVDKIGLDIAWNTVFTIIFIGALTLAVQKGVLTLAITVLAVRWLLIPLFTLYVNRKMFSNIPSS